MTRRLLVAAALVVAFGAFFLSDPPPAAPRVRTIGLIQHRGQFYRIEDLMDPKFRAASNDPFVKSFAPPAQYALHANPWAGVLDEETPSGSTRHIHQHRYEEMKSRTLQRTLDARSGMPWAGLNGSGD